METLVVPPGDNLHVPVVQVRPAREVLAQEKAGKVRGDSNAVEEIYQVPVDDGVELG